MSLLLAFCVASLSFAPHLASGNPIPLGDLKIRLVEQRSRGAENHLSEEEMDTFLQTPGRPRSKPSASSTNGSSIDGLARESLRPTDTIPRSVTPGPRSTKRHSNNMVGSGKFRDHTYHRSVARERAVGRGSAGRRSANSSSPTISGRSYLASTTIPEDSPQVDLITSVHDSDTTHLGPDVGSPAAELEQDIRKTFRPDLLRSTSLALEKVIREFKEEAGSDGDGDDKVLIPRSPAPESESSLKGRSVDKPCPLPLSGPTVYEARTDAHSSPTPFPRAALPIHRLPGYIPGMPRPIPIARRDTTLDPDEVSPSSSALRATPPRIPGTDRVTSPSPSPFSRAALPVHRLPGYIPGMPRPIARRETTFDPDGVSPFSSTLRATPPRIPGTDRATSRSNILRRDSTSVRHSHRTSSPLQTNPSAPINLLLSGVNGRFTPDRSHTPDGPSLEFGSRKYRKQSNYRRTYPRKSIVPRPDWDLPDTDSDSAVENDDRHNNHEERFFDVDSGSYIALRSIKTASRSSVPVFCGYPQRSSD